jgi:hypothetical protein
LIFAPRKELAVTSGYGSNGGNGVGETVYVIQIGGKGRSITSKRI